MNDFTLGFSFGYGHAFEDCESGMEMNEHRNNCLEIKKNMHVNDLVAPVGIKEIAYIYASALKQIDG